MATDDEKLLLRRSLERVKQNNTPVKGKCSETVEKKQEFICE